MAAADVEYKCFVGNLAWDTTDQTLTDAFSRYGDILTSKIMYDHETGRSKGFGFVTFKDERSKREAIREMDGRDLDGRSIVVDEAKPPRDTLKRKVDRIRQLLLSAEGRV